ncbi:MAG: zinc ABC transporter substrate-binding protein [Planctomycetaceae bacterium]
MATFIKTRSLLLSAGVICLLLIGCSPAPSSPPTGQSPGSDKRLNIVCTVSMVTDIVQQIAGDHAEVSGLLNEGVDPHVYIPTTSDTSRAMKADLVFYCGLHLEGKMVDGYAAQRKKGKPYFAVTDGIPHDKILSSELVATAHDPHVWGDVQLWMSCAREVEKRLSEVDPAHAADYAANSARLQEELQHLDSYIREVIASIPEPQRTLVTAHDAFGYFSRAYNIRVKAVQGISTDSEAGMKDVNELVAFLVENKIPTVFVEASVSEKDLRAVIEGAQQQGAKIQIGGTLYSDSMGPKGTYEGTYIGMQDHNATLIARSLGGKAPERGWKGKLQAPVR